MKLRRSNTYQVFIRILSIEIFNNIENKTYQWNRSDENLILGKNEMIKGFEVEDFSTNKVETTTEILLNIENFINIASRNTCMVNKVVIEYLDNKSNITINR